MRKISSRNTATATATATPAMAQPEGPDPDDAPDAYEMAKSRARDAMAHTARAAQRDAYVEGMKWNNQRSPRHVPGAVRALQAAQEAYGTGHAEAAIDPTRVTREHENLTVTVPRSTPLAVTLPANPTTGYDWHVAPGSVEALASAVTRKFVSRNPELLGAGGKTTLEWPAGSLPAGSYALRLLHKRPWEERIVDTFSIFLRVE